MLLCEFRPFSAPAVGCGSLYYAPVQRSSQFKAVLGLSCSCVGLVFSPLQPLAAEACITHRSNGRRNARPFLRFLVLCGFGERSSRCKAVLAFCCSCEGWVYSPSQPLAAEAFFPHRPNLSRNARQSLRFPVPVSVGAILRSSRWLRKPFFRTGQTHVAMQGSP